MTKEKKDDTKRQTKAGMMKENDSRTGSEKGETAAEKDSESTPKMSKEKAEGHHGDKPLH
jgi:hypothetical protein